GRPEHIAAAEILDQPFDLGAKKTARGRFQNLYHFALTGGDHPSGSSGMMETARGEARGTAVNASSILRKVARHRYQARRSPQAVVRQAE
ncbi:MAG: hypothetical protein ACRCS0_09425, partial [Albidovulum sp.]